VPVHGVADREDPALAVPLRVHLVVAHSESDRIVTAPSRRPMRLCTMPIAIWSSRSGGAWLMS